MEMNRDIFAYFNGVKAVHGDPLALRRKLTKAFGPSPERMWEDLKSPDDGIREGAEEIFLRAVREAMDLIPFDPVGGHGALDADVYAAYDRFSDYLNTLKKKKESTPTSVQPMDLISSLPNTRG